jgi:hypothetical protein
MTVRRVSAPYPGFAGASPRGGSGPKGRRGPCFPSSVFPAKAGTQNCSHRLFVREPSSSFDGLRMRMNEMALT